jgi:protease-4
MHSSTYRTGIFIAIAIAIILVISLAAAQSDVLSSCNVAYIPLHGVMVTYVPDSQSASSNNKQDQISSENVTRSIRDANANSNIQAIVVEIDSPGGDPVAGEEIESALKNSNKPTVALIRSEGNSAAYMAATGADTIFASQFSNVGDIGITSSYVDQSKQNQSSGITFNQLSIGKYKDMFDPNKPFTADERILIMSQLQTAYQYFVQIVATNRHLSVASSTRLSNGESFLAEEALLDGLIDQIGNVDTVRSFISQKINADAVICGIDSD